MSCGRVAGGILLLSSACSEVQVVPDDDDAAGGRSVSTGEGSTSSVTAAASSSAFMSTNGAGAGGEGGASAECPVIKDGYYFSVDEPMLSSHYFGGGCDGDPFPAASYSPGGKCGSGFHMRACMPNVGDTSLFAPEAGRASGAYSVGSESYVLTMVAVDFVHVGEVGGSVRGTFEGTANGTDGTSLPVTGSFFLCRLPDLPPCP